MVDRLSVGRALIYCDSRVLELEMHLLAYDWQHGSEVLIEFQISASGYLAGMSGGCVKYTWAEPMYYNYTPQLLNHRVAK